MSNLILSAFDRNDPCNLPRLARALDGLGYHRLWLTEHRYAESSASPIAKQLPSALMQQGDSILARLERGVPTDSIRPVLASLFRPSVQPYLISWFKYSAVTELATIKVPCLIEFSILAVALTAVGTYSALAYAVAAALLIVVAIPACVVPVHRATRVDPVVELQRT